MSELAERIKKRLAATGKTARGASLDAGLSDAFIRNILTGKARSPGAENLAKLARALQTSEVWLLRGEGEERSNHDPDEVIFASRRSSPPSSAPAVSALQKIPELKRSERSAQSADASGTYWSLPSAFLQHDLHAGNQDLFITAIVGDSMVPTLMPGDRVVVDRSQTDPADGIFVVDAGGELAVKRLEVVKASHPLWIRIRSDNPLHGTDEIPASSLKTLGRVVCRITRI
jgi:phage repressor protein C with HTH and peptisase S24 domain